VDTFAPIEQRGTDFLAVSPDGNVSISIVVIAIIIIVIIIIIIAIAIIIIITIIVENARTHGLIQLHPRAGACH
jgi:uncharacterized membrane protein YqiK